jgi:ABC-type transport system substrate-binding protein
MATGIGAYFQCCGSNTHWKVLDFNRNLDYVIYNRMCRTKQVYRLQLIKMIKTILCAAIRTHLIASFLRLVSIMFVILLLAGCSQQEDAEEKAENQRALGQDAVQRGGVYRYPLMNNPSTLDPIYLQDQYGAPVVRQVFEGLVQFGPYLTVLPGLAETWQVENNGRTYRLFLRPTAQFHNGHPVTADDAIFSIQRLIRVNPAPTILPQLLKIDGATAYRNRLSDAIRGLKHISDHEFTVTLIEPHVPFLAALGMYQAAIVPKLEVENNEKKFGRAPVGSGPFQFVSWKTDDSIQLDRFVDYYAGEAHLDKILYRIYPGVQIERALSDFQTGGLEEMPVYGNIRQALSEEQDYQWFHRPSLSLQFYGIRSDHPVLNNPALRKALSLAIDRDELVQKVYDDQFEPARSILPPGMPMHKNLEELLAHDMTAARKHMDQVLKDNRGAVQRIEIVSGSQSASARKELDHVRNRWEQLGLEVDLKFITDWGEFERYIQSDAVQIYRYAWIADIPDPDNFLFPLFASDSPANFTGFRDERIDRMLVEARGIVDPVQRAEMYQQIEKQILQACPIIPLLYLSIDRVYQPEVQGVKISALGATEMPLHRIWLKGQSHR